MHSPDPVLVLERATRVRRDRLAALLYTSLAPVTLHSLELPGEPLEVPQALDLLAREPGEPFAVGSAWGGSWTTTWFTIDGVLPPAQDPDEIVELVLDLGWFDHSVGGHVEAMVYRPDGTALKGIHPRNGWLRLRGPAAVDLRASEDGSFRLLLEAAANPLLLGVPPFLERHDGAGVGPSADPYVLRRAEVCRMDTEVWELDRDLDVVTGLIEVLPTDSPRRARLVLTLEQCLDTLDCRDRTTVAAARQVLAPVLAARAAEGSHELSAVAHSHIDSAWLWPARESRRKVGRTLANVLTLQEMDPEAVFAMSAGLHLHWLAERHPDLAERVRERAQQGRIVPVGGTWVEPDAVLPTGESLVRQIQLGLEEFSTWFPTRPRIMWLPDSFGYSGALPQIVRRAGYRWFLTQKISWNDRTVFPHHTFTWEGLDGSTVLTHFPPVDTYAASVTPDELHHAETRFRDQAASDHSLLLYGYGDGGGGPTREMTARAARLHDLAGAPRVTHRAPEDFFCLLEEEGERRGLPVWSGELYLELHRGTFTSQAAMKRGVRECESLLRTAEYLVAYAVLAVGAPSHQKKLDALWKELAFCQFHDVLPGTSIPWVHREARRSLPEVADGARTLAQEALLALGEPAGSADPARGSSGPDGSHPDGSAVGITQAAGSVLVPVGAEAKDDWRLQELTGQDEAAEVSMLGREDGTTVLDNGLLRAVLDRDGLVTSLIQHSTGRELVAAGGRLGQPVLFRDEPTRWDAWDIDRHTLRHPQPVSTAASVQRVSDDLPGQAFQASTEPAGSRGLRARFAVGPSTITVTTTLAPGSEVLTQHCEVEWEHTEHLLKVNLPLAASPTHAVHETQYGCVSRPVHANTPADEAQYEVPTHRWLRLEEAGWGIGVVNDAVYGCDTTPWRPAGPRGRREGTLVRLSLLRAPRFPDPDTDRGHHHVTWQVVPGRARATLHAASALNAPMLPLSAPVKAAAPLLRLSEAEGTIVLDWVKPARDGEGVIARFYEPFGAHASARLVPADLLAGFEVCETDLLEGTDPVAAEAAPTALVRLGQDGAAQHQDLGQALAIEEAGLAMDPFQITTLRLRRPQ